MAHTTESWPELRHEEYEDTRDFLHMITQIAGKIRLALTPPQAQWAHAPLRLSVDGLTTTPLWVGDGLLEVDIDLVRHRIRRERSDGRQVNVDLRPRPVAGVYRDVLRAVEDLDVHVTISPMPQEVTQPIPFDRDTVHTAYDPEQASRLWRALTSVGSVFQRSQSGYWGKQSQVNFAWGNFDLSVARYSGRPAPRPQGLPQIMAGWLDAEMASVLFAFGNDQSPQPGFMAMGYPQPAGIDETLVRPATARWMEVPGMGGMFTLPYEDVRTSRDPAATLLEFALSTYEAFADLGGWNRSLLEQRPPEITGKAA
jgi:hypothetical protein